MNGENTFPKFQHSPIPKTVLKIYLNNGIKKIDGQDFLEIVPEPKYFFLANLHTFLDNKFSHFTTI